MEYGCSALAPFSDDQGESSGFHFRSPCQCRLRTESIKTIIFRPIPFEEFDGFILDKSTCVRCKRYGADSHKSRLIDQALVGALTITDQKMKGKKFEVSSDVEASRS
ncbi:hypothetical protein HMPREF1990_01689 [Porphyromonas gingivalis W4087]|nr:hypothetical protein HMPREF1990_01689 [Porphyromonas gingivalis W4087]